MDPDATRPVAADAALPHEPAREPAREPGSVDSAELFRGAREIVILHNRERYVLRITRQGKLILNK